MPIGTLILLFFIAIPIAEIWVLIEVGGIIGVFPTIALVVLTAFAGTFLIRHQGTGLLMEARARLDSGQPPVESVVGGAFLLVAGALLLTPGFITDFIGFLCLFPPFRRVFAGWVWARYGDRIKTKSSGFPPHSSSQDADRAAYTRPKSRTETHVSIIEGEFVEVEPDAQNPRSDPSDSPWATQNQSSSVSGVDPKSEGENSTDKKTNG